MSLFLVSGYKPIIGQTKEVFQADTKNAVSVYLNKNGPDAGGFVQYSVEEIATIPESHLFTCPHCSEKFPHPTKVINLSK
jgi:hypothetical protein